MGDSPSTSPLSSGARCYSGSVLCVPTAGPRDAAGAGNLSLGVSEGFQGREALDLADSPVRGTVRPAEGPGRAKSRKGELALLQVGPPPSPAQGRQHSWSSGTQTQIGGSSTGSPGPQTSGLDCNHTTGCPGAPACTGQITVCLGPHDRMSQFL